MNSCSEQLQEEENKGGVEVTPVFPETVLEKNVNAGDSVCIAFVPNMDWKLSISGDGSGNMFWLDDDGMKSRKIEGQASSPSSEVEVMLFFSENEEFDRNRVCTVTLEMGGESKEIAILTRLSLGRTSEIYVGIVEEDGFKMADDKYVFGETEVETADLMTFADDVTYSLPVRFVSNFDWNIALPSWITSDVMSGSAGVSDLLLTVLLSDDVLNGCTETVRFVDAVNPEEYASLSVELPSVIDRIEYEEMTTFTFNKEGDVRNLNGAFIENIPAVIEMLSTRNTIVRVLERNEDSTYVSADNPDWVTVSKVIYEDFEESALLAKFSVNISVTANDTYSDRNADVFLIPASKAVVPEDDWFDSSKGTVSDEYKEFIIGNLFQEGLEKDYVYLSDVPEDIYLASFSKYEESQWWASSLGTSNQYRLVYSDKSSDAVLLFDTPFASYEIRNDDFEVISQESAESYWIKLNSFASNSKGRVVMNPDKYKGEEAEPVSYIVFYDENSKVLGAIECSYSLTGLPEEDDKIFKVSSGGIAEIKRLSEDTELYMIINGSYNVTEIYDVIINDKSVYLEGLEKNALWNFFMVDAQTFEEIESSSISVEPLNSDLFISLSECDERTEVICILQTQASDKSLLNFCALRLIYDPEADIEIPMPFAFVNPAAVEGKASLSVYEGELVETIVAEWGESQAPKFFYELKYTDSEVAKQATITVPSIPSNVLSTRNGLAWGNYPPKDNYWLSATTSSGKMTVYMTESGKVDYFLFLDAQDMPLYVLICTYDPSN